MANNKIRVNKITATNTSGTAIPTMIGTLKGFLEEEAVGSVLGTISVAITP